MSNWSIIDTWYVVVACATVADYVRTNWDNPRRAAMQKLPRQKVRNIGVANFDIHHLEILLRDQLTTVIPCVNQIELHPYNPTPRLVSYCKNAGIQCLGYSPLGSRQSRVVHEPLVLDVASKNKKTPQQVLLMWGLQKGWGVVVGSFNPSHIISNFQLGSWSLAENDLKQISSCETRLRVYTDLERTRLPSRVFFDEEVGAPRKAKRAPPLILCWQE